MQKCNQKTRKVHRESYEIFKKIFEFSAAGMALADKEGRFIRINPSFSAITGYTEAELLGTNFKDITHPDDLEADLSFFLRLQKKEINCYSIEKRCLHKNGSYIWLSLNSSSISNTTGRLKYYIMQIQDSHYCKEYSFIDISLRGKALFENSRAYHDLKQIFNSISTGMCLIDKEQNIARINDLYLKFLNKSREELIGSKCFEIMSEIICNCDECPFDRIMNGGKSCEFESHQWIDENTKQKFIITANAFTSPNGEIQGIILSFTDITEISKLEAKIAEVSEYERQKLGQLLHDELSQLLTGLTFRIEALKSVMNAKAYPEAEDTREMSALIKAIQSHIRRIMIGLYPASIKYDRLFIALNDMAAETEKLFHVKCSIVIEGKVNITNDSDATQLFYIAKESVNNAIKHANATEIIITLSYKDNMLMLLIQNNINIKVDIKVNPQGLGLRIMEYRAKLIGARFEYFIENNEFKVRVWRIPGKSRYTKNGK